MKLGFSSFSFKSALDQGRMDIADVVRWIGGVGGEHIELASMTFSPKGQDMFWNFYDQPDLLEAITSTAAATGIALSGICIPANFLVARSDLTAQVERVKRHVDLCAQLGIRYLRHDVTEWARKTIDIADLEDNFGALVDCSAQVARYAADKGVVTSIENHGFYMNSSERVRRLIHHVGLENFRTTIDVGNFLCVDEDPLIATELNLPYASFVHLKDFYIRPRSNPQGDGWLKTTGQNYLLGSIIGYGDMDTRGILGALVAQGYDGYLSIEFEGNEDCLFGCEKGLVNTRRLLTQLQAG